MKRGVNGVTLALIVVLTLTLVGLGVTPANAQVSKGSISGSVTDPQGATVLGASVKVVSKDTNQAYTTETDSAGLFRLSLLPPGIYRVEVAKQGFRKTVVGNVEVAVGADRGLGTVKLRQPWKFLPPSPWLRVLRRRSRILSRRRTCRRLQAFWKIRAWISWL